MKNKDGLESLPRERLGYGQTRVSTQTIYTAYSFSMHNKMMNGVQSILHSLVLNGPYGKEEEAEEEAAAATPSPISGIAPGSFDTVEESYHAKDFSLLYDI